MPKGEVFWRGGEWVVRWEKSGGGFSKAVPVRFASVLEALKATSTTTSLHINVELKSGSPDGITFIDKNLAEKADQDARERERIKGEQKKKAEELQDVPNQGNQQESGEDTMKREFHNPYNFVPAPQRGNVKGELADTPPCGHDRFDSDKYSGKLHVKMTVKTPLLLPDTTRMHIDANEHKSYPVRVKPLIDENGNVIKDSNGEIAEVPDINPTAIKGMLRSAYEAVTNSRLSVFQKHDERLAFRMESTEGARSVPARIEKDKIDGKDYVVLYTGTSLLKDADNRVGEPKDGHPLCSAWILTYDRKSCRLTTNAVRVQPGNRLPNHKDTLWAWLEEFERYARKDADRRATAPVNRWRYVPTFKYWRVRFLSDNESHIDTNMPSASTLTTPAAILEATPTGGRDPQKTLHIPTGSQLIKVKGFACLTGKNLVDSKVQNDYASPNIENKHDERLFFNLHNGKEEPAYSKIEFSPTLRKKWDDLIKNYRLEHKRDFGKPANARRGNAEVPLQWSRHIRETSEMESAPNAEVISEALSHKALCYARVVWNATRSCFDIVELYPVGISRRVHEKPPSTLLPKSLHPAKLITQLSPADRVFGWVRQSIPEDKELTDDEKQLAKEIKDIGAYRGQIRIGAVECKTTNSNAIETFGADGQPNTWLPLQILGQPKPQQGRFYVAQSQDGAAQPGDLSNEEAGFMEKTNYRQQMGLGDETKKGLRGRKIYPHHNLPDTIKNEYWQSPLSAELKTSLTNHFREFRRPQKEGKEQRDSQNRSIQGWVKQGVEFEFDIHFTNLSDVELGALVWLLSMNKENEEKYFHRFGGGKPLGFGSVRIEITEMDKDGNPVSEVRSGKQLAETRYGNLNDDSFKYPDLKTEFTDKFEEAVRTAYPEGKFLKAFKIAAEGFRELPVHYPRTREQGQAGHPPPNPAGESFKWFVQNSRTAAGVRPGHVLPDLENEEGLPILEVEAARQQRGHGQGQGRNDGRHQNRERR